MDANTLVDRTQQLVGNRLSSTLSDAWYLDRVQDAYDHLSCYVERDNRGNIARRLRFPELYDSIERTIASGLTSNFIANSAGVRHVEALYDVTNENVIERVGLRRMRNVDPDETGEIYLWAPTGDTVSGTPTAGYLIWQLPEANTTVREDVYKVAETLSVDGDGPVIPAAWHPAIYMLAAQFAAELEGQLDLADRVGARATTFIARQATPAEIGARRGRKYVAVGATRP